MQCDRECDAPSPAASAPTMKAVVEEWTRMMPELQLGIAQLHQRRLDAAELNAIAERILQ